MRGTILLFIFCCALSGANEPTVDGIAYANPDKYLKIAESLGDLESIEALATELKRDTGTGTIQSILDWKEQNISYNGELAYEWRDFDTVLSEKAIGGCADESILCGALLKAAGIPTIWVKTMDVPWIWRFKKGEPFSTWSGHVFLEVYVNNRWMLLDPGAKLLYEEYATASRLLPGDRFAYHKGDDPKTMIMSLQWEEWKKQTADYFTDLDESLLPVDSLGATLLEAHQIFVIANSPHYQVLSGMAREKGYHVRLSFNTDYDTHLPAAKGHTVLIETHGRQPIVPKGVLERYFPDAFHGIERENGKIEIEGTEILFFDVDTPGNQLDNPPE